MMIGLVPLGFVVIIIAGGYFIINQEHNRKDNMLKVVYTLFLAILIALFVGFGINAFYPAPTYPEYPAALNTKMLSSPSADLTPELQAQQEEYTKQQNDYQQVIKTHSQNASSVAIGISVLLMALSLLLLANIPVIADGTLVGGVFTLLYGISLGFMSSNGKFQFAIVSLGLAIALVLGYIKFIRPENKAKASA